MKTAGMMTLENIKLQALIVRPAHLGDVDAIFALITSAARSTTVLPRTRDGICENLRDFVVAEAAGEVLACGALNVIARNLAEVKSLVVSESLRGQGVGPRVVRALMDEARRLGLRRIFALTDNVAFFEKVGFTPVDKGTLPHKVWNECIRCPKFLNCQEEAVEMILTPPAPTAR